MARTRQIGRRTPADRTPKKHIAQKAAKKSVSCKEPCDLAYIAGRERTLDFLEENGFDKETLLSMVSDVFWIADDLSLSPEETSDMLSKLYFLHRNRLNPELSRQELELSQNPVPARYSVKLRDREEVIYFKALETEGPERSRVYYCEICGEDEEFAKEEFIEHAKLHLE
jgi:hypothetical protein